jgi:hypothetical protein
MAGFRKLVSIAESTETRVATVVGSYAWGAYLTSEDQARTNKIETAEIEGLTEAQAIAQTATSGWEITSRNRVGAGGFWTVTEERITEGTWATTTTTTTA